MASVGTLLPGLGGPHGEPQALDALRPARTRGRIVVDAGAARALRAGEQEPAARRRASTWKGPSSAATPSTSTTPDGRRIACGITNYDDREVEAIRGLRSDRIAEALGHEYGAEVVHRNNLVLL